MAHEIAHLCAERHYVGSASSGRFATDRGVRPAYDRIPGAYANARSGIEKTAWYARYLRDQDVVGWVLDHADAKAFLDKGEKVMAELARRRATAATPEVWNAARKGYRPARAPARRGAGIAQGSLATAAPAGGSRPKNRPRYCVSNSSAAATRAFCHRSIPLPERPAMPTFREFLKVAELTVTDKTSGKRSREDHGDPAHLPGHQRDGPPKGGGHSRGPGSHVRKDRADRLEPQRHPAQRSRPATPFTSRGPMCNPCRSRRSVS